MSKINVTVWNEFIHEKKEEAITKIYPQGIHGAIAQILRSEETMQVRTATLDMPDHGLSNEVLNSTDVLIWWGHIAHEKVSDVVAERVKQRVLAGMGLIVLHSGHLVFLLVIGFVYRSSEAQRRLAAIVGPVFAAHVPDTIPVGSRQTHVLAARRHSESPPSKDRFSSCSCPLARTACNRTGRTCGRVCRTRWREPTPGSPPCRGHRSSHLSPCIVPPRKRPSPETNGRPRTCGRTIARRSPPYPYMAGTRPRTRAGRNGPVR